MRRERGGLQRPKPMPISMAAENCHRRAEAGRASMNAPKRTRSAASGYGGRGEPGDGLADDVELPGLHRDVVEKTTFSTIHPIGSSP